MKRLLIIGLTALLFSCEDKADIEPENTIVGAWEYDIKSHIYFNEDNEIIHERSGPISNPWIHLHKNDGSLISIADPEWMEEYKKNGSINEGVVDYGYTYLVENDSIFVILKNGKRSPSTQGTSPTYFKIRNQTLELYNYDSIEFRSFEGIEYSNLILKSSEYYKRVVPKR